MKCISKENVHCDEIFKILPHKANILNIKAQRYFFNVSKHFNFIFLVCGRMGDESRNFFSLSVRIRGGAGMLCRSKV